MRVNTPPARPGSWRASSCAGEDTTELMLMSLMMYSGRNHQPARPALCQRLLIQTRSQPSRSAAAQKQAGSATRMRQRLLNRDTLSQAAGGKRYQLCQRLPNQATPSRAAALRLTAGGKRYHYMSAAAQPSYYQPSRSTAAP